MPLQGPFETATVTPGRLARAGRLLALLSLALLLTLAPGRAHSEDDIRSQSVLAERIRSRIEEADLGDGIGVSVVNLSSGRTVAGHNAATPRNPASNMKLITSAVSLRELGADFIMRTGLYGQQRGDEIEGGLYLKGFGDPTLDHGVLLAMAQELVQRGVRKVDELIVDGSYFDDQILPPAFEQQPNEVAPFRAAISAIAVNGSAYTLRVRPGVTAGSAAHAEVDASAYFDVTNDITTSAEGPARVIAVQTPNDGKLSLRLSGSVPLGITGASYRRRVESPLHYAGYAMAEALRSMRVQLPMRVKVAPMPSGTPLLTSHQSPPLSNVLYALGKHSDNFVAEMLLKVLAAERVGQPGRSEAGARLVLEELGKLGIAGDGLKVVNGSGLFDGNQVAPAHLTKLLATMYADPDLRAEYLAQLAVGGVDGTLHRRLTQLPAPRIVRAKTGTLADVIALSGYVLGREPGRAFAFSFLANGVRGKHHAARSLADGIVSDIAMHLWSQGAAD
ncbi:MAG: D-alanyl-D-alanine carboxypeptidase/D-alanyl-D-alanine-endopeptidase [Myxococcales bacterium]|jgi:D-alanyl-D-alanine carboxypeptidase/D-alanyl-D-alanine-endopeptidase (penicillin-binding protein 4)